VASNATLSKRTGGLPDGDPPDGERCVQSNRRPQQHPDDSHDSTAPERSSGVGPKPIAALLTEQLTASGVVRSNSLFAYF
jgi:hypothetical protein